jgi:hypothetical protein
MSGGAHDVSRIARVKQLVAMEQALLELRSKSP